MESVALYESAPQEEPAGEEIRYLIQGAEVITARLRARADVASGDERKDCLRHLALLESNLRRLSASLERLDFTGDARRAAMAEAEQRGFERGLRARARVPGQRREVQGQLWPVPAPRA